MKYKVGDKVRVRADLVEDEIYSGSYFVYQMSKFMGEVFKVKSVSSNNYQFEGVHWSWTDEMLEDVTKYKIGDMVRIRRDLIVGKDYGVVTLFHSMTSNLGKDYVISDILDSGLILVGDFAWSEEMIECKVGELVNSNNVHITHNAVIKNRDFSVLFNKPTLPFEGLGGVDMYAINTDICISVLYGDNLVETCISKDADKELLTKIFSLYGYKVEIDDRKVISDVKELHKWMQENGIVWNGKDFYEIMSDEGVSFIGIEALQDRFDVVIDIC